MKHERCQFHLHTEEFSRGWRMAQSVQCLPWNHAELHWILELIGKITITVITVAHTYNPNARNTATGRSLGLTDQPA